jgi:hypothetical protein
MGNVPIPKSYRAAVDGLHAEYWRAAIEKELSGLLALQTWDMILVSDLPKGANIVHSHFVGVLKNDRAGRLWGSLPTRCASASQPRAYVRTPSRELHPMGAH